MAHRKPQISTPVMHTKDTLEIPAREKKENFSACQHKFIQETLAIHLNVEVLVSIKIPTEHGFWYLEKHCLICILIQWEQF